MHPPKAPTLARYGLTEMAWSAILANQGGHCAVCQEPRKSLCVDHEHVRGWKKLPPPARAATVRGLLCFWCNTHFVGRGISAQRARNVVAYLEAYARRKSRSILCEVTP